MKKVQFVLKSLMVMGALSQRVLASEFDDDVAGGDAPRGEKTVSSLSLSSVSKLPESLSFAELVALERGDIAPNKKEEPLPKISLRIYLPRNLMGLF